VIGGVHTGVRNTRRPSCVVVTALLLAATPVSAQQKTFVADPAHSSIEFTLGASFHTVHGKFQLKSGSIRFDEKTGAASGQFVADATSGDTGNKGRDRKMHQEILESRAYPEILFTVQRIKGTLAANGTSQVVVDGEFTLHGQAHPISLTLPVQLNGDTATADAHFVVPYTQWGLKNPSTFVLRVSDKVDVNVHVIGRLAAGQ
jgi:polyisoprenoid-binding protein YceI